MKASGDGEERMDDEERFYEDVSHDVYRKVVRFGSNDLFLLNLSVSAVFCRCFVQYSIVLISYSIMLSFFVNITTNC